MSNTSMRFALVGSVLALTIAALTLLVSLTRGRDEGGIRAAFDAEFMTRPDGYPGLKEHYGFSFSREPRQMDPGLMYRAIADKAVDLIDAFATDGRIPAYDLLILEDDKGFFPPYYAAPVVRASVLKEHPELEAILNRLSGAISDEEMRAMNYRADEEGEKAGDIALAFLVKEGLLPENSKPGDGSGGTVRVGGKHFTEQEIVGEIIATLIEHATDIRVKRNLNLGGTMICFNALKSGDLDIYAEYTGTGLVNILDRPAVSDPVAAYEIVSGAFLEDYGIKWLEPLGFNNTYTLAMRKGHAERLGIDSISDLVAHINGR